MSYYITLFSYHCILSYETSRYHSAIYVDAACLRIINILGVALWGTQYLIFSLSKCCHFNSYQRIFLNIHFLFNVFESLSTVDDQKNTISNVEVFTKMGRNRKLFIKDSLKSVIASYLHGFSRLKTHILVKWMIMKMHIKNWKTWPTKCRELQSPSFLPFFILSFPTSSFSSLPTSFLPCFHSFLSLMTNCKGY